MTAVVTQTQNSTTAKITFKRGPEPVPVKKFGLTNILSHLAGVADGVMAATDLINPPCWIISDFCHYHHEATGDSGVLAPEELEGHFGSTFRYQEAGVAGIAKELIKAGDGSRGVIFAWRDGSDIGHFFNAVNHGGNVKFLDGQAGGYADPDWDHWEFMCTGGGAR
ncbi:toxin glutamine deamidase domain-containing protein [Streptomyces mirabilis]|uniref:toxin glutamine deamidase domain-containing protein n=1 Tax=Streptomyces mirabilis TaxID=68239 RepID=UPI0031BB0D2A